MAIFLRNRLYLKLFVEGSVADPEVSLADLDPDSSLGLIIDSNQTIAYKN
jgi:hypothetical protein